MEVTTRVAIPADVSVVYQSMYHDVTITVDGVVQVMRTAVDSVPSEQTLEDILMDVKHLYESEGPHADPYDILAEHLG